MKFSAIIVEDDEFMAAQLHDLLTMFCPEINVIGITHCSFKAEEMIKTFNPELVFMDIEMPDRNAFQLLEKLKDQHFDIIFTTAYDHYALKAFDYNSIHYVIKPITKENITKAVQKYIQKGNEFKKSDLSHILDIVKHTENGDKKIHLPRMSGFSIVSIDDIIRFEADGSYTKVFKKADKSDSGKNEPELLSIGIKKFELQLNKHNFFRCHNSHLVNLNKVKAYIRGEGGMLEMENGVNIPVSKAKKEELLIRLKGV
jgi:two-component system, LytTR family, response regulator